MPMMITRFVTSRTTAANSKTKRARHGFEKNWNRFDEPLKRFLGGTFSNRRWVKHKQLKNDLKGQE